MRIVAGTARGRTITTPKGQKTIRPTADRVRETLFNVLGQTCDGLSVLDLYAGTGALSLESLSRGARSAVMVDSGAEADALCRQNAGSLGFAAQVRHVRMPVERAWPTLANERFDLVFADPPYALEAGAWLLAHVPEVMAAGARFVLETGKKEQLPETLGALVLVDARAFGDTMVRIFSLH